MHRRDLLKLFGIGATIVPVIGGVPEVAAPARLIAEPQVETVKLAAPGDAEALLGLCPWRQSYMTIEIVNPEGRWRFGARSFVTHAAATPMDVTSLSSGGSYIDRIYVPPTVEWELRGSLLDAKVDFQPR